jgi:alkaline phosphatase D
MSRGTSRRDFLKTIVISAGAIKAAPLLAGCGDDDDSGTPDAGAPVENVFAQSVVSGDPRPTSIVLWTRAASAAGGDLPVVLQLATDAAFASMVVLSQSDFTAREEADGCLRIKVTELAPGTRYYYRFRSGDSVSPTGRFKTAAAADSDVPVRFAVLSCQDYIGRHYNTLLELLDEAQDDLDFVVHLGDYVYETTGDPQFQQKSGRHITFDDQAGAQQLGSGDGAFYAARSLSNYRQLWRTYRSDPTLQKVHEKFPFIAIWDDHEFADDCWQDAINYSDGVAVLRDAERRRNAEQAFFENQPLALDSETGDGALSIDRDDLFPNTRLYRDFRFGQHVHLLMTDYRSFRPDHPVAEDGFPGTVVMTAADVAAAPGGPDVPVELLAPYVDIDSKAFAVYKAALEAILPAAYMAGGADEERAAALTAAAIQGNIDAKVINRLIEQIPEETRPPAIPLDALDAGISLAAMGKSGLFGQLGARYLSIKPTYDVYAAFRTASGNGDDPYGEAQATWIAERLDAEADATWKLFGNSTALTSLIVDLEPFAEQIGDLLPATQLYLDVDQWDGFPAAREVLLAELRARNAVILSGDIHAAYFSDYGADEAGNRVVEFTGPGVSSGPFAELLQSTAESIPDLAGNPLVGVLIGAIDTLLPAGFGPVEFSNSKVNGVMVFTASGAELVGRYAMLLGAEALVDQTGGGVEFQRKQVVIPKVDGKNGVPTIS